MRRIIAAVLLSGAWMAPQRSSAPDKAVPFRVGEVLTYDLSWLRVVSAGTATFSLKERQSMPGGRAAYHVVAEARPAALLDAIYRVYYKADALIDTSTLNAVENTVLSDERGQMRTRVTRFLANNSIDDSDVRAPKVLHERRASVNATLDPLSAMYVARTWPFATGRKLTIPLSESGNQFQMRAEVTGLEPVDTGIGKLAAWRVVATITETAKPKAPPEQLIMWFSNDARRLPVRLDFALAIGSFVLTLVSVTG